MEQPKMWNKKGKRKGLICFNRADIAKVRGVSTEAIHQAKKRGILDLDDIESVARYILYEKKIAPIISPELPKEPQKRSEIPAFINVESTSNEEKYASSIEKAIEQPKIVLTTKEQTWKSIRNIWKMNKNIEKEAKNIQDARYITVPVGGEGDLLTGDIPPEWFPEKDQEEYAIEYNKQDF